VSVSSVGRRGTLPGTARWREAAHAALQGEEEAVVVAPAVAVEVDQAEDPATTVASPATCPVIALRSAWLARLARVAPAAAGAAAHATSVARRDTCHATAPRRARGAVDAVLTTASVTTAGRAVICHVTAPRRRLVAPAAEEAAVVVKNATNVARLITFSATVPRTLAASAGETNLACVVTTATRWGTSQGTALSRLLKRNVSCAARVAISCCRRFVIIGSSHVFRSPFLRL
jgi:hypothetical protein